MAKKALFSLLLFGAVLAGAAGVMIAVNPAPKVARVSSTESDRPYVVKLHARWCAVCAFTKPAWAKIEKAYSTSVNLVVFDFTNSATTEASRAEAKRLGLETFFEEHAGSTGTIAVIDGRTKKAITVLEGRRSDAEYHAAIEGALKLSSVR